MVTDLLARAALAPQLTPSPSTKMAEFFLAMMAKVSAMGLPAGSPVIGWRSYRDSERP